MWPFNSKKTEVEPNWPLVRMQIEQEMYPEKQKIADKQVERAAIREAEDMFQQWMDDSLIPWPGHPEGVKSGLYIPKPQTFIITQYPGQKSRWESGSYREFVSKSFEVMKDNWLSGRKEVTRAC